MKIAVLDDERRENENLLHLLNMYSVETGKSFECKAFTSGNELLNAERFDLYFLDYMMDEMDGVAVGKVLAKKFGSNVMICYLTGIERAAADVINAHVPAVGFLKKPVSFDILAETMNKLLAGNISTVLQLKMGRTTETVKVNDVYYIEAFGKKSGFHFECGCREYSHLLAEIESMLEGIPAFLRVQRSYIVNMNFIQSYDAKYIRMANGEEIPYKIRNFAKLYRDFIFDNKI